jgi:hypothetical protein
MTRATMASVVVALLGLSACGGGDRNRDSGPPGIDANIPANDAFVATCGSMAPEDSAAACGDSCDNDGDRFADCDDFDCCGAVTCPAGTACGDRGDAGPRADAAVMTCATAGMENTAGACGDGCDNEPDGFADCNDFDCCSLVSCGADTACGRRGDAGVRADAFVMACATAGMENTAGACGDGCDNEPDGFADCNDFDCCSLVTCGADTACGRRAVDAGPRADAFAMACATAGMENTAGACGDGCDNEPDGFADCDDFDCCDLVTCGADTGCGRRASGENNATTCNDMTDNDGDRFVDCDDRDCCGVREMSTCAATTYIGRGACG